MVRALAAIPIIILHYSTITVAPISTRLKRSITSSFIMRMQPEETALPMLHGWVVP